MGTNEILIFGDAASGGNILTQAAYAADAQRSSGHQPGTARQELENKVLRQVSVISAAVAQFVADNQANNVVDTTAPATLAGWLASVVRTVGLPIAVAGGTADALTADLSPNIALTNGATVIVRADAANTTATPTLNANALGAKTIVKGNNLALVAGDIAGAGHWLELQFDTVLDKWVLQNPFSQVVQIASTAEAQAGTNNTKLLTPLRLREGVNASGSAPVYAARAWGNLNMTGTPSIRASGNVASITDHGVGDWTVNFTTAMPDANFATVAVGAIDDAVTPGATNRGVAPRSPTTTSVRLVLTDGGSGSDPLRLTFAIFR